jgi:CpeT protein
MKLFLIFFLLNSFAHNGYSQNDPLDETDLNHLQHLMTGYFSTQRQAESDTIYFHINLCMKPIWTERNDGFWLYVEQAANATPDRPYRQRVYHLYLAGDKSNIVSKVYEIENPLQFTGGCNNHEILKTLTQELLIERPGCELYLRKISPGLFAGNTPEGKCLSTWRGAAYVTSDVTVDKKGLMTWDRGWDGDGNLVWGPEEGGYFFERINKE